MINLLSEIDQRELAAARTNSLILRYIFLMSLVVTLMALEILAVYFILTNDAARHKQTIADNQSKATSYASTQQEAAQLTSDLTTAKYILEQQTTYTDLLVSIANALPNGATIDNLSLDPKTFGTPTTLAVKVGSPALAITTKKSLQEAFLDNTQIFTDVNIQTLAQANGGGYTVTLGVTFTKGLGQR
jgi:hypothetical protein